MTKTKESTIIRRLNWTLLVVWLALLVSAAEARNSWKLRVQPKRGSEQQFVISSDVSLRANLGILGQSNGKTALRIELDQRVVDRRRRGPVTLELTYRRIELDFELGKRALHYDSADPGSRKEEAHRYVGRLVGRTITLEVSREGEILDVRGLEDLWEGAGDPTERDELLETVTQGLGTEMLRGLFAQATPLLPTNRVRTGATWDGELLLPDPAFGELSIASQYEVEGAERKGKLKSVRLGVDNVTAIEGRGPLLDQLGAMAGARGEVRARTRSSAGSGTLWIERKTGLTSGMEMDQQMLLELSAPIRVLGFKKTVRVPVQIDQQILIERVQPQSNSGSARTRPVETGPY